jgi:hypothetical protein
MIAVLMVNTMRANPSDGSTFESERTANRKEIFDGSGNAIAPMRQQTMVPHTNTHVDRKGIQNRSDDQVRPANEEKRGIDSVCLQCLPTAPIGPNRYTNRHEPRYPR